ncbi:hypothetical protein AB0M80_01300 [Amycolatopsis sp. NPDC051045]|uniref:hypothetical protein n=1 Tax=Amycolatopsis sp. NPDC051045 TaxID=3156922 RepID=UPI00341BDCCB
MSTERREPGEDELLPPPPAELREEDWGGDYWSPEPMPSGPGWGNQGGAPGHRPAQPMRQLDSEDGPPPRRGGPTG